LTLKGSHFGSKPEVSEQLKKDLIKCGIIDNILTFARARQDLEMGKKAKTAKNKKMNVEKLEDANLAGSRDSANCTLVLAEGDSAKALVISGFSVVGRDTFGVFPLKGKLLNVREAKAKQLAENAEIHNLMKIIGLIPRRAYEDVSELRYGSVMIMTDQDVDGSHIKGLIINFFDHYWPNLL
jgi:DNA topoisomerase-2